MQKTFSTGDRNDITFPTTIAVAVTAIAVVLQLDLVV